MYRTGDPFVSLCQDDLGEEEKKPSGIPGPHPCCVTTMEVAGEGLTQEINTGAMRRGGVRQHDEPIRVEDDQSG